jgi:hypothetical protein
MSEWRKIYTKAMTALQVTPGPAMAALMERANLTQEEAMSVISHARMVWGQNVPFIANVDDLSAIERQEFDGMLRFNYGARPIFNVLCTRQFFRPRAHPDVVQYVENVLDTTGGGVAMNWNAIGAVGQINGVVGDVRDSSAFWRCRFRDSEDVVRRSIAQTRAETFHANSILRWQTTNVLGASNVKLALFVAGKTDLLHPIPKTNTGGAILAFRYGCAAG